MQFDWQTAAALVIVGLAILWVIRTLLPSARNSGSAASGCGSCKRCDAGSNDLFKLS